MDSILFYLQKNNLQLYMTTLQQMLDRNLSSSETGTKLEYLLGIYYASTSQTKFHLPDNLCFSIGTPGVAANLRTELGFADWMDDPCIVC
jgi:hypothetical protein